ncbi:MAG: hypothetical protein AAFR79_19760 [Pseudomonadota bacterium]
MGVSLLLSVALATTGVSASEAAPVTGQVEAPLILAQRKASVHGGVRNSKRHWTREVTGRNPGGYTPPSVPGLDGASSGTSSGHGSAPNMRSANAKTYRVPQDEPPPPEPRMAPEPQPQQRTWLQWLLGF